MVLVGKDIPVDVDTLPDPAGAAVAVVDLAPICVSRVLARAAEP